MGLILDLIYPRRCPICDDILGYREGLCCGNCEHELKVVKEPYCMKCGKPLEEDIEYCFDCTKKEFTYIEGRAVYVYDTYMKNSIARFKYKGRCEYADFYVEKIIDECGDFIKDRHIDVIIPVPIHKNKLHKRGYNQAGIIAKRLGEKLGIKVILDGLLRTVDTVAQKQLDNLERKVNLMNAIRINDKKQLDKSINNILIIDDIYTTGATIDACAKQLKRRYVNCNIYYVVVAIGKGI